MTVSLSWELGACCQAHIAANDLTRYQPCIEAYSSVVNHGAGTGEALSGCATDLPILLQTNAAWAMGKQHNTGVVVTLCNSPAFLLFEIYLSV